MLNDEEIRTLLKSAKVQAGGWKALATQWDSSAVYLSAVASGTKGMTQRIANKLGYRRVDRTEYEPLREVGR